MTRPQSATYHAHFKGSARQSTAFNLAMQELAAVVARREAAASLAAQPLADAAQAAEVQTLPDGNHGETLEVTKP